MKLFVFLLLGLALVGCSESTAPSYSQHQHDPLAFEHAVAASFSPEPEVEIVGALIEHFAMRREYSRVAVIRVAGQEHKCDLGGFPGIIEAIRVYKHDGQYVVVSDKCNWFMVNPKTGDLTQVQKDYETASPDHFLGDFDPYEDKYQFSFAKPGEHQVPAVWKGG